jgi:hypothetical protein
MANSASKTAVSLNIAERWNVLTSRRTASLGTAADLAILLPLVF